MEAAAKNNSDIIIQFSNSGGQFFAGFGLEDSFEAKVLGTVSAAQHVHLLAEKYGICVITYRSCKQSPYSMGRSASKP